MCKETGRRCPNFNQDIVLEIDNKSGCYFEDFEDKEDNWNRYPLEKAGIASLIPCMGKPVTELQIECCTRILGNKTAKDSRKLENEVLPKDLKKIN